MLPRFSRWWSLIFSVVAEIASGTMYTFSVFSPDLKKRLALSQSQIQLVGTAGNIGGYLGIPAGFFFDRFGPRRTGLIGAVLVFVGYFMMWAIGTQKVQFSSDSLTFGFLCFFAAVAGNSNCWLDTMAIVTNSNNFPLHRSSVIGLLKSFLGLSGAVTTQIYSAFFAPDSVHFLFFIAVAMASSSCVATFFINFQSFSSGDRLEGSSPKRFTYFTLLVAFIAVFLLGASVLEEVSEVSRVAKQGITAVMIVLLFSVGVIPFLWRGEDLETEKGTEAIIFLTTTEEDGDEENNERVGVNRERGPKTRGEDDRANIEGATYLEAIRDPKFILLFFAMMCGSGTGLMMINNMGQITQSLGAKHDGQDVFVSILSVCSCLGRLIAGVLSQKLESRINRPWFFFGAIATMGLAHVYLAFSDLQMLYVACVVGGLAFGAYWSLMPAMCADMFGLKNMGSIYATLGLAPSAGSYLFSQFLASKIYQDHAEGAESLCSGQQCFRSAFLINAGADCFGAILAVIVCFLSRPVYAAKKEMLRRRFQE